MASVPFTISPAPGITNDLIAVIYNTLAPAAEVARIVKVPPHNNPYNFNFTNIPAGIYIVKIHESPDGVTLGTLRHDFWVDATLQKLMSYNVVTFQVGAGRGAPNYDPANQDTSYVNPDIDGLTYTVFKPGYGPLDWAADITLRTGGGFTFTNGQVFAQDEIYTLLISNLVTQPITQAASGFPLDFVPIIADTVFNATHYNKVLEVETASLIITITVDLTTIPNGTQFAVNTHDHHFSMNNVIVQLAGGQTCLVNGTQRNAVLIGQAENVTFFKSGSLLKIVDWQGDYRRTGSIIYHEYGQSYANAIPLTGYFLLKASYPRLFNWYVNVLPVGDWVPVSDGVPPVEFGKWGIGQNYFWVPDHRNMHYRINDGTRHAGDYQADELGPGQVRNNVFTGQGVLKNGIPGGTPGVGVLATLGDGGDIFPDSASGTNNNAVRITPWTIISPHGENRVKTVTTGAFVIM